MYIRSLQSPCSSFVFGFWLSFLLRCNWHITSALVNFKSLFFVSVVLQSHWNVFRYWACLSLSWYLHAFQFEEPWTHKNSHIIYLANSSHILSALFLWNSFRSMLVPLILLSITLRCPLYFHLLTILFSLLGESLTSVIQVTNALLNCI